MSLCHEIIYTCLLLCLPYLSQSNTISPVQNLQDSVSFTSSVTTNNTLGLQTLKSVTQIINATVSAYQASNASAGGTNSTSKTNLLAVSTTVFKNGTSRIGPGTSVFKNSFVNSASILQGNGTNVNTTQKTTTKAPGPANPVYTLYALICIGGFPALILLFFLVARIYNGVKGKMSDA